MAIRIHHHASIWRHWAAQRRRGDGRCAFDAQAARPNQPENSAYLAGAARRTVPARRRRRQRPNRARPSCRPHRRLRRQAARVPKLILARTRATARARHRARADPARTEISRARHLRAVAHLAADQGDGAGRAAWPRRQRRGPGAADAARRRNPRLYAAWRLAGLLPRHAQRRLLSVAGAAAQSPHRSVSVRKQLTSPSCTAT